MQLRILRVQVHNTNMFMEMFYIYMLKINPELLMIDTICVMLPCTSMRSVDSEHWLMFNHDIWFPINYIFVDVAD